VISLANVLKQVRYPENFASDGRTVLWEHKIFYTRIFHISWPISSKFCTKTSPLGVVQKARDSQISVQWRAYFNGERKQIFIPAVDILRLVWMKFSTRGGNRNLQSVYEICKIWGSWSYTVFKSGGK